MSRSSVTKSSAAGENKLHHHVTKESNPISKIILNGNINQIVPVNWITKNTPHCRTQREQNNHIEIFRKNQLGEGKLRQKDISFSHNSLAMDDSTHYSSNLIGEMSIELFLDYKKETSKRTENIHKIKPVVHKLNAASLAQKIKLRAQIVNKSKIKDPLLKPQMYCKNSVATQMASTLIMPCKNILGK